MCIQGCKTGALVRAHTPEAALKDLLSSAPISTVLLGSTVDIKDLFSFYK